MDSSANCQCRHHDDRAGAAGPTAIPTSSPAAIELAGAFRTGPARTLLASGASSPFFFLLLPQPPSASRMRAVDPFRVETTGTLHPVSVAHDWGWGVRQDEQLIGAGVGLFPPRLLKLRCCSCTLGPHAKRRSSSLRPLSTFGRLRSVKRATMLDFVDCTLSRRLA